MHILFMDDQLLVRRCIRGETRAWRQFIDAQGPAVYDSARYTLRRVLGAAREEDIENVYQSVFLALCEKNFHRLRTFQGRSSLRTWLVSVTSRFALNHIRTEKRKGSLKFATLDDAAEDVPDRGTFFDVPPDERETLFRCIDRLPERERLLVKLFYFDGLSYGSIAGIMRLPVNSISPLLSRAREQLRSMVRKPPDA